MALALVGATSGQTLTESALFVPADVSAGDYLGQSVALSGDTALVSAMRSSPGAQLAAGAAYVFVRDGGTWVLQAKLVAEDAAADDVFGSGVALAGDTAIVGAMGDDGNAGAAYVFVRTGTTWTQQAKLVAGDRTANDRFGWSVSLHGDTAVAGAPQDSRQPGVAAGSAHVFVRQGTTWTHQAKLEVSDRDEEYLFGRSVALAGDTLVVGAPWEENASGPDAGVAYVFQRVGTAWPRQARLVASDPGSFDQFGSDVALSGDTALVGAKFDSHDADVQAGSAYVFVRAGAAWTQQAKLVARDATSQDLFGAAVALSEDTAVVGANYADESGAAYLYTRSSDAWTQSSKLVISAAAPGDLVGNSVAVSGRTAVLGAVGSSRSGRLSGSAAVFELPSLFVLDFETEDDFVTPLGNGQKIDAEFGRLVRISGAGANAGPALFDTTPGGPNDPALNDDMLIGHGNVLLLEDDWYSFAETVPGYFDVVTDDPHGGDLCFDFLQPVEPCSVLLADINPPPNRGASVTLLDAAGRARVYTIEPGWTGGYGDAGPWRLDLTTTLPQSGNGTPRFATATEVAGFQQDSVVRIVVHLTGFGAIDELTFRLVQASATARNGSGRNLSVLRSLARPVLGDSWSAELDCSAYAGGLATLTLRREASTGTMTPFGEVLVAGQLLLGETRAVSTAPNTFAWSIPSDLALLGVELHLQGACWEAPAPGTGRVRRLRGGLSNALDLVLGF